MDFESIGLSEISPTEKDEYWKISDIFKIDFFKKIIEKEIRLVVTKDKELGEGELEEGGQKVQNSTRKVNKYQGCNIQHNEDS